MKFAKFVFLGAGVWGILVLTPLFFLFDLSGRHYPAPMEYPNFFYGFLSVTMVCQFIFLVISSDPARYRPLMIPCVFEKLGYIVALIVLHAQGRVGMVDVMNGVPDLILCVLFVAAFVKTRATSYVLR